MSSNYINIPAYGDTQWESPVDTAFDLPTNGNQSGDVRVTLDTDTIYIWNGADWIAEGGGSGSGTVTEVSIVTANGVSGTVANPTTTPAITLALGAITPTSVAASSTVTGSNLSGTNSGDVTLGTSNGLALSGQILSLGTSSATTTGVLSSTDWSTFNGKQSTLTLGNLTDAGTDGITIISGTGAVVGSGTAISQHVANTSNNGYLTSTDWNTFNGKQASGSYLTTLTGDGSASGPGSSALTLASVNSNIGSFTNTSFTVNAKGLITAAASGTAPVTSVGASAPLSSTGGLTPTLAISQATTSTNGYLSFTDWNTFNGKQNTLTFSDSIVNAAGVITLVNDSASPGFSQYYGTNSSGTLGYFSIPSGSTGANTSLSNLASVAINLALLPGVNNSISLGSSSFEWASGFFGGTVNVPAITTSAAGGTLTLTGGVSASPGNGGAVTINGAAGSSTTTGGNGGTVTINGGAANGTNNNTGGAVNLQAGASVESGTGGTVTISSGTGGLGSGTAGASGGTTNVNGGTGGIGSSTSGNGGGFTGKAGSGGGGVVGGNGGTAQLVGGTGGTGSASGGNGGPANVQGGSPGNVAGTSGGSCTIAAGNGSGTGGGGPGGAVTISSGTAGGDNTANNSGGSLGLACGHSIGSSSGAALTITAGTGGIGTGTTGANGGNTNINAGNGGLGSSTGGTGGNVVISAGTGGNSGTPGTGGFIQFLPAATISTAERFRITATECYASNAQLEVKTAGFGLGIAHGTNCKLGTAVLAAGTVTVANTAVTANSLIFLTSNADGGTPGSVRITAKTAGTSFVITSLSAVDTSTVAWMIVEAL